MTDPRVVSWCCYCNREVLAGQLHRCDERSGRLSPGYALGGPPPLFGHRPWDLPQRDGRRAVPVRNLHQND